jgi:hypothetical protein
LNPYILLNTLFSNTLRLCSSRNIIVLHPYKTAGKIMVLNIVIAMFVGSRRED